MTLYKSKSSRFWWVDLAYAGGRFRCSTKQTSMQKARSVESALLQQLSEGLVPGKRGLAPTLKAFAPRFLHLILNSHTLAAKTKAYYENGWRLLAADAALSGMRLDAITTSVASTLATGGSGSNLNNALRTLRRMLSVAKEERLLTAVPTIRLVAEHQRHRLITPEEEQLLLDHASRTVRDAFLLTFDTGMRPGEVAALAWANVDLPAGTLRVIAGKTRNARRQLEMTERVRAMLIERARVYGGTWVFPSRNENRFGEHVKTGTITGGFVLLRNKLGLPRDLVFYSARHTFATDLQTSGRDLSKTQRILGHGNVSITQRYVHSSSTGMSTLMDARNDQRTTERHVSRHTPPTIQ